MHASLHSPYHAWWAVDCLLHLCSLLTCVSPSLCSSLPTSTWTLSRTFIHVDNAKANITCAAANQGVLLSRRTHSLPQRMSPSSLTTSTVRRVLKWSCWRNPATKTRCPRTCVTQNSTMKPSGKCYLHHQRTEDKHFTLMKKVSGQLIHFAHTQGRRDPITNLVRSKKRRSSREMETRKNQGSLSKTKSKLSMFWEPRFRDMTLKPILTGQVFRNSMELSSFSEEKFTSVVNAR